MGRKSKRTPELCAKVLALISGEFDGTPYATKSACAQCKIGLSQWHAWCRDDADGLGCDFEYARGRGQALLERRVLSTTDPTEARVITHRLSRLDIDDWGIAQTLIHDNRMSIAEAAKLASAIE